MVVMNEFSKLFLCDDSEEREKQVEDHLVGNEELIERPVGNDGRIKRFGEDRRYSMRERRLHRDLWENRTLPNMAKSSQCDISNVII